PGQPRIELGGRVRRLVRPSSGRRQHHLDCWRPDRSGVLQERCATRARRPSAASAVVIRYPLSPMAQQPPPAEIADLLKEDRTFAPPEKFRAQAIVRDDSVYARAERDPE